MNAYRLRASLAGAGVPAAISLMVACGGVDEAPRSAGSPAVVISADSSMPGADSLDIPDRDVLFTGTLRERPSSRAEVHAAFGEPDSTTSRTVPNRHVPGVTDTLVALHYPGTVIRFHVPGAGGELLSQVDVSDNRYLVYGLIGAPIELLERQIGPADESGDSTSTYLCRSCVAGDDPVTLVTRDGRIARVRFAYYVD